MPWSFFDARTADTNDIPYDDIQSLLNNGRPLLPGEIGCYASHAAVWREFLASGDDQLVVLEDDVIADWDFLAKLAAFDLTAAQVPFVRLFTKFPPDARLVRRNFIEPLRFLLDVRGPAWGAQGYALTREGAERFVRHCRTISRPIDLEFDRTWAHGMKSLCIFPYAVIERSIASTIGDQRRDPEKGTLSPFLKLRRKIRKHTENARARLYWALGL